MEGVVGWHGDGDLNDNRIIQLQLCCNNTLCIMNTFFEHRDVHKYTWCRDSFGQRSLIDSCTVSADLFRSVLDVRVKRGAGLELLTDPHLVCNWYLEILTWIAVYMNVPGKEALLSIVGGQRHEWFCSPRPPLQTMYHPCFESFRNTQRARRLSGSCSKQL